MEQDSIIISYEKNLKEKESLLKKKDILLEEAKIKSDDLNIKIEESLRLLVDKESEINKFDIMIEDVKNKINMAKNQLVKKQETFEVIRDEYNTKND